MRCPAQRVQQAAGGFGEAVADETVLPGAESRAQRGDAGDRRGRKARLQGRQGQQTRHERGIRGVLAQQVPAESVDQQDTGGSAVRESDGVGEPRHAHRAEQRRQDVGQRSPVVIRSDDPVHGTLSPLRPRGRAIGPEPDCQNPIDRPMISFMISVVPP